MGTRRLGAVIARRLAAEGVPMAICYRSSPREAGELQQELQGMGAKVFLVQGDMTKEEDVQRVVTEAAAGLGGLRSVINLASGFEATPFAKLDSLAWDEGLAAAKGSYLLAAHGARKMMQNEGPTRGHIVFFSDWAAGETPYAGYLPYLTGKAAVTFMTKAFAVELAAYGILVNAVAPGPTIRPPDITEADWEADVVAHTPLKRESSSDDIAEIVATLLKSETITGETIRVDSGRHLAGPGVEA